MTASRSRTPETLGSPSIATTCGVGEERDLLVGAGAVQHDPRRAELLAAVDEGDTAGEAGQEGGFLHRRVAAADHRDVLVAEEEPVTGGTGAHTHSDQRFLTGHAEAPCGRTHRENHGARLIRLVADGDGLHRPVQRDRVDVVHPQIRAEAQRLLAHLVHQFGSGDALAEAGVVLHLGGGHQRAAELGAFEHQRCELSAGRIDGGRVAGRARADDDDVMNGG